MCCVLQEEVAGDPPGGTRSSRAHLRQPEEGSGRSRQVPREDGGRCTVAYALVQIKLLLYDFQKFAYHRRICESPGFGWAW